MYLIKVVVCPSTLIVYSFVSYSSQLIKKARTQNSLTDSQVELIFFKKKERSKYIWKMSMYNTNSSTVVDITYGRDVTNTWQFPLLIIFLLRISLWVLLYTSLKCVFQVNLELLKDGYQGDFIGESTPDVVVSEFVCFLFLILLQFFAPHLNHFYGWPRCEGVGNRNLSNSY